MQTGKEIGKYEDRSHRDSLPRSIASCLHDVVVMYQANLRVKGSHKTKISRRSGRERKKKMYRQKGHR